MMNANIKIKNIKRVSGELVGNIFVKGSRLRPINCPGKLAPFAIDEYPLLFSLASTIKGVSKFSGINFIPELFEAQYYDRVGHQIIFSWGWSEAHPRAADDKDPPGKRSPVWADEFQRQSAALEYDVPTATLETDSGGIQGA